MNNKYENSVGWHILVIKNGKYEKFVGKACGSPETIINQSCLIFVSLVDMFGNIFHSDDIYVHITELNIRHA